MVANWTHPYRQGVLTELEMKQLWEDGFVIKHNLFSPKELQPSMDAIDKLVDDLANKLHSKGHITDLFKGAGFYQRLTLLERQFPSLSVLLHKNGVLPEALQKLWSDERLLSVARQALGDDIAGHPVWNLRCKTPGQEQSTVPWHQDAAYLDPAAWSTLQLTAWIPMIDANRVNGCMQVVRGGHRSGRVAEHTCCVGGTWYVDLPESEMQNVLGCDLKKDIVTCEVPLGSALFLNNLIPHRSLDNKSSSIRWSVDLRWQRPSEPSGFEGIKDMIIMAKKGEPSFRPDWKAWAADSRTEKQSEAVDGPARVAVAEAQKESGDEFDTTIAGPWMNRWRIVHHNRHTAQLDPQHKGVKGWHKA